MNNLPTVTDEFGKLKKEKIYFLVTLVVVFLSQVNAFRIDNFSRWNRDLDGIRKEVSEALKEWERFTPLRFIEVSSTEPADIKIAFAVRNHGDDHPFDGTGRVLAHAFTPGFYDISGDVHLDDDEYWTLQLYGDPLSNVIEHIYDGDKACGMCYQMRSRFVFFSRQTFLNSDVISLRSVVLHELGHSLGLAHSMDDNSIMYAFYQHSLPPELTPTDIRTVQSLYGRKISSTPSFQPRTTTTTTAIPRSTRQTTTGRPYSTAVPPRATTSSPSKPNICETAVDATTIIRGELFIFKDRWLWRFGNDRESDAEGSLISHYWSALPNRVDAAVENGKYLWFFVDDKMYTYDAHHLISVQSLVGLGLPSYVRRIRLAYAWNYWPDKPIYIWTDDEYWKFDKKSGKVELGYPRKISSVWHNIPEDTNAAATLNNDLYFFSASKAVKFFSMNMSAGEPFPVSRLWRNCPESLGMYSGVRRSQYSLFVHFFVTLIMLSFCL